MYMLKIKELVSNLPTVNSFDKFDDMKFINKVKYPKIKQMLLKNAHDVK